MTELLTFDAATDAAWLSLLYMVVPGNVCGPDTLTCVLSAVGIGDDSNGA
jgi:hypothetical protein